MSALNSLPSIQQPIAGPGGIIQQPWLQFLATLVNNPGPIAPVLPTGSPFAFTASENGTMAIAGGTISAISVTRARVTVPAGVGHGVFPLSQGDTIIVTYSVIPTMNFIPR